MRKTTAIASVLLAIVLVATATGCGKRIPKASSPEVERLILQIAHDFHRDELANRCWRPGRGYDFLYRCNNVDGNETAKTVQKEIDDRMRAMHFSVRNIHIEGVDKEVGRIRCGCDVLCNDQTQRVAFTAQYNDDGDLYVEVIGLSLE
jgi:hypothetical protein